MIQLVRAYTEHVFLDPPSTQAFVCIYEKACTSIEYIKACTAQVFAGTGNHTQVKDLSQFQWKSAHAPKKELPKDFL